MYDRVACFINMYSKNPIKFYTFILLVIRRLVLFQNLGLLRSKIFHSTTTAFLLGRIVILRMKMDRNVGMVWLSEREMCDMAPSLDCVEMRWRPSGRKGTTIK